MRDSEDTPVADHSGHDPLSRPLRVARWASAAVWLTPLLFVVLLAMLRYGWDLQSTFEGGSFFILYLYAALGLSVVPVALAAYFVGPRLSADPVFLAALSILLTWVMAFSLLLGFVASVLYTSNLPFATVLALSFAWWWLVWPRRARWERWIAAKRAQESSAAHRTSASS